MLGRWEIQVASRVPSASGMSVEDHGREAKAVPLASVGCVMEHPFEVFVILGRQDVTAKSQALGIMSFPQRIQTLEGRSWLGRPGGRASVSRLDWSGPAS